MTSATLDLGARAETVVLTLGILVAVGASYYTGTTGDWVPLMIACVVIGLVVALTMVE